METKVENVINCAIDRLNELLPTGESLSKEKTTTLLGRGGRLDSTGFVNLLVALEEELEKQLGVTATLVDEVMMNQEGLGTIAELHELLLRVVRSRRPTDDMTVV